MFVSGCDQSAGKTVFFYNDIFLTRMLSIKTSKTTATRRYRERTLQEWRAVYLRVTLFL